MTCDRVFILPLRFKEKLSDLKYIISGNTFEEVSFTKDLRLSQNRFGYGDLTIHYLSWDPFESETVLIIITLGLRE